MQIESDEIQKYVVSRKLLELHERKLAFPAGLEELLGIHGPKE